MDRGGDGVGCDRRVQVTDLGRQMAEITCWKLNVFGKTTVDLPSDHTGLTLTQIITTSIAPTAAATDQIIVYVHPVPRLEALDVWTDLRHIAGDFVTDDAGQLATRTTTAIAVPDQGEAEATGSDLDQDFAGARLRHGDICERERTA
jgi:hypothetical protein